MCAALSALPPRLAYRRAYGVSTCLGLGRCGVLLAANCVNVAAAQNAPNFLDCEWDADWARFRRWLADNAERGFPFDSELAMLAQELLQAHQDQLAMDPSSAYGISPGMQSFFASCNAPASADGAVPKPFCIYGAVAALWVVARAGHPDRQALLEHAQFLLGKNIRHTMDFMESSSWTISSLDVLANLEHPAAAFRVPPELAAYRAPRVSEALTVPAERQVPARVVDATVRIVVWEIGVHASLSAEPLQMWARFVPRGEFAHRNLIRDQYPKWLPDKCDTLYKHHRLTCDNVEDDITQLFRRRLPHSATAKDPIHDIDGFAEEFKTIAGDKVKDVDVFLCTVAYLCLLAETHEVPVLGYFGHPLLFMVPQETGPREYFWYRFMSMTGKSSVGFAVSDPFLQMQFEYQVGAPRLPAIRTHALYTGATHVPARPSEVLVMDRPHECVLMCIIQRLLPASGDSRDANQVDWPLQDGRLRAAGSPHYPYRFLTRAHTDRSFKTFATFRAALLWPYDMDLITFYEFYGMGTPILMPAHLPKYIFQQDHMWYDGQWAGAWREPGKAQMWPEDLAVSPFNETSLDAVRVTVRFSDYFRFPAVQHFVSVPDLLARLPSTDFFEVVQEMARFNQESLVESANAWRALLRRTTGWDAELLQL